MSTTRVGSADSGTPDDQSGGGGASPTSTLKAHQRLVRDRRAREDADVNLFGRWWQGIDLDISRARVQAISYQTAEKVVLEYEWLGVMPGIVWHAFGIYFDGHLGGVAVFGPEYGENLGVWDRYGFTGKIVALTRGACVHWAHPHAGSKLIQRSLRLLPAKYEVVTATVDSSAGEVGTIYQACGWSYVGVMNKGGKRRALRLASGRVVGERNVRKTGMGVYEIEGLLKGSVAINVPDKARYFTFRGPRRHIHRGAISHLIAPYPKRSQP